MSTRLRINIGGKEIPVWFNNFSKVEIAKNLLKSNGNFPAKPQEIELILAIEKMSNESHLLLMREILWAGIIGHCNGNDEINEFSRKGISILIAEALNDDLISVWMAFLESIGMNLDKVGNDETEASNIGDKKKATS